MWKCVLFEEWGWSMNFLIGNFYVSHSGRMPNPTIYLQNFHPHGPCSYCSSLCHSFDNIPIFHMSRWTPIFSVWGLNQILISTPQIGATTLISRGKLMLQEIMLPKLMNCTILNIRSSTTNFLSLHPVIILHKIHPWKTPSKPSYSLITKSCKRLKMPPWSTLNPYMKSRMQPWLTRKQLQGWKDSSII